MKHGLTAERVVMFDEDPAAFEAMRGSLYAFYNPSDPIAEHLVEHVAASMWRLRRVPEIETAIYAYFRLLHENREAEKRVAAQVVSDIPDLSSFCTIRDEKAHAAAEMDKKRVEARLEGDQPVMGEVFGTAERSLISLVRIAGAIEGSMYRAIRELDRMKPEQPGPVNDNAVIDVDADEDQQPDPFQAT